MTGRSKNQPRATPQLTAIIMGTHIAPHPTTEHQQLVTMVRAFLPPADLLPVTAHHPAPETGVKNENIIATMLAQLVALVRCVGVMTVPTIARPAAVVHMERGTEGVLLIVMPPTLKGTLLAGTMTRLQRIDRSLLVKVLRLVSVIIYTVAVQNVGTWRGKRGTPLRLRP